MIPALLLILAVVAAGTLVSYLYVDDLPIVPRLAVGAASGLAGLGIVGFVLANVVGIGPALIVSALIVVAVCAIGLHPGLRARVRTDVREGGARVAAAIGRPSLGATGELAWAVAMAVLLWLVFSRVIVVDAAGAMSTGYVNNLGDLPLHMQISAGFAYGQNFPPQDPTYAGTGFAYPYMADFVTAMLLAAGASMHDAFLLTNMALGLALVALLHRLTRELTRDRLAALLAPVLVLLSGGLGWIVMLREAAAGEQGLLPFVRALPHDYTIGLDGYRWGNAVTSLLVPQRGLLFGMAVALVVLLLLLRLLRRPPSPAAANGDGWERPAWAISRRDISDAIRHRPEAPVAGLLTGLLPLVHAHTFAVVIGTAFLLGVFYRQWRERRWPPWAVYVVAALAIALPEIWWSTRGSLGSAGTFFGIELGWDHGSTDPVVFWLLNTGVFIPLIVLALAVPRLRDAMPRDLVLFSIPFAAWFVLPNLVKLAPWVWDNIKVLIYWYVGFVPLVALVIAWLLRDRLALRIAGLAIVVTMTLAGALDIGRVLSGQTLYGEFDGDALGIARAIVRETPPRALILHAPIWNAPVFLTGRQSLLGYPGHVWSRGLDYAPREADIKTIYAGGSGARPSSTPTPTAAA